MFFELLSVLLQVLGLVKASSSPTGCHATGESLLSEYQNDSLYGVNDEPSQPPHLFDELPPICALSNRNSIEYCVFTSTKFANNRGISVLTSREHADGILNLRAFTDPDIHSKLGVNQFSSPGFYAKEIKGRGVGLIANRTIKQGEWLMSFTPAFIMSYEAYSDLSEKERLYFQRLAFERLPEETRRTAYELYGQEGENAIDSIDDILDTNTFSLPVEIRSWAENDGGQTDHDYEATTEEEVEEDEENEEEVPVVEFKFLFPEIARFNHACRPSADYLFDSSLLTQHIIAHRDIFPGEELTITYIYPLQKHRARQKALHRSWGFHCDCSTCSGPPESIKASDARIDRILEIQEELDDTSAESDGNPLLAEQLIRLLHQERLWSLMRGGYTAAAVEHNGVGDERRARTYAQLALQKGHICRGVDPRDGEHLGLLQLLRNPRAHESWQFRLRE